MLTRNERGHDQGSARARHPTWPEEATISHFKRRLANVLRSFARPVHVNPKRPVW
jgi:hypothetical protein